MKYRFCKKNGIVDEEGSQILQLVVNTIGRSESCLVRGGCKYCMQDFREMAGKLLANGLNDGESDGLRDAWVEVLLVLGEDGMPFNRAAFRVACEKARALIAMRQ